MMRNAPSLFYDKNFKMKDEEIRDQFINDLRQNKLLSPDKPLNDKFILVPDDVTNDQFSGFEIDRKTGQQVKSLPSYAVYGKTEYNTNPQPLYDGSGNQLRFTPDIREAAIRSRHPNLRQRVESWIEGNDPYNNVTKDAIDLMDRYGE